MTWITLESSLALDLLSVLLLAVGGAFLVSKFLLTLPSLQEPILREEAGRPRQFPRSLRLGGIALFLGFLFAFWFDDRLILDQKLLLLLLGALLALLFGLWDDLRPLPWPLQFLGQVVLGGILVLGGMSIEHIHFGHGWILDFTLSPIAWLAPLITVLWVVLVINAINWIDGSDGLMGGVAGVALITLFFLSLRPEVNQPAVALLIAMFLGGVGGFLMFNWFPARIEAGSGGTFLIGFFLAVMAVYAGTKVATALLVLLIPILDALAVLVARLFRGHSPFLPDKLHFHHVLRSLGWSPVRIALLYAGGTAIMGMLALSTRSMEKLIVFLTAGGFFLVLLAWTQWIIARQAGSNSKL